MRALAQIMEENGLGCWNCRRWDQPAHGAPQCGAPAAPTIVPVVSCPPRPLRRAGSRLGGFFRSGFYPDPVDFNNITEVKSPMVGVFYDSPSPDAEPYVKVGSKVKKGDVLCIIEAMKLMNEITAQVDGEIVDVCAQNGQVVEYNQPLFKIF